MPGSTNSVLVHAVWTLAPRAPQLTDALLERVAPYVTRWAKTLQVTIWVVGGTGDALHLLLDAPVDRTVQSVTCELQAATARFANDTLGIKGFVWQAVSYEGVGLNEKETVIGYIQNVTAHPVDKRKRAAVEETSDNNDALPDWLQEALAASKSRL